MLLRVWEWVRRSPQQTLLTRLIAIDKYNYRLLYAGERRIIRTYFIIEHKHRSIILINTELITIRQPRIDLCTSIRGRYKLSTRNDECYCKIVLFDECVVIIFDGIKRLEAQ